MSVVIQTSGPTKFFISFDIITGGLLRIRRRKDRGLFLSRKSKFSKEADTRSLTLILDIEYPEIEDLAKPRHRFMSSYEQRVQPFDKRYQYLLFAAEPYEIIAFKVPSTEIDKSTPKFFSHWDPDSKMFTVSQWNGAIAATTTSSTTAPTSPPQQGAPPRVPPPPMPGSLPPPPPVMANGPPRPMPPGGAPPIPPPPPVGNNTMANFTPGTQMNRLPMPPPPQGFPGQGVRQPPPPPPNMG
ncbi:Splicing factor 3A subunit 2, partial [Cucurbita argyrosperma subsp. sororia]